MGNRTKGMTGRIFSVLLAVLVVSAAEKANGGMGGMVITERDYFHVDGLNGNDNSGGLTPATAFATIQKAIAAASHGDVVLVYPGLYRGEVNFQGKGIVVQGVAAGPAGIPVLHNPGDFAVSFFNGEGSDSILTNFVIRDSFMAVFIAGSSPTISNVTVVDNTHGIEAYVDSEPMIANSIFWRNSGGDLFGCQANYSRISQVGKGRGNITTEPLFVDPDSGDYHLFSQRGRYWTEHDVWVLDLVTSPCIDGGSPNAEPFTEPMPNGGVVNMGAYGGTTQASLSPLRLPGRAFNPSPADGAVDLDIWTQSQLTWDPGLNAIMHDVYFGVENPPPLISTQAATQFDPWGTGGYPWGTGGYGQTGGRVEIGGDATYYWRVDEIDSEGNKTTGTVWTFTTGSAPPPPKGRTCFVAETDVWMDGSLVPISNVGAGRSIRWAGGDTMNSLRSLPHPQRIQELQEHEGVFECHDVLLESGNRIGVAERHYFLTESGKWLAVQNLKRGTRLQTATGSVAVVSVTRRSMPYIGKVYNLKVEGSDRYLVGKDALVVRDY